MTHSIYRHRDPRDKTIRYVGRSKDPLRRLASHILNPSKTGSAKDKWIEELVTEGLFPLLEIIESGIKTIEEAKKREAHWIRKHIEEGHPLTNTQIPCQWTRPAVVVKNQQCEHTVSPSESTSDWWKVKRIAQKMGVRWVGKWTDDTRGLAPYVYQYTAGKANKMIPVRIKDLVRLSDDGIRAHLQALLEESESLGRIKTDITSGQVPDGYEIIPPPGLYARWFVNYNGQRLTTPNGNDKYFSNEFNATLFCWKHAENQATEEDSYASN